MTKPKRSADDLPATDADYFGSVLSLVASDDPDIPALQALLDARPINASELCELFAALRLGDESSRQRKNAENRYRIRKMAMLYVADLWANRNELRGETKQAFSERMVKRVWEKFKVSVKPKTVESRWLTPGLVAAALAGKKLPPVTDVVGFYGGRLYFDNSTTKRNQRDTIKVPRCKN